MVRSVQIILLNNNIKFETCRLIVNWLCNYYEIVIFNTPQQNVVIWECWKKIKNKNWKLKKWMMMEGEQKVENEGKENER
jgi:hypothetical protein